jgi:hypothetical protein
LPKKTLEIVATEECNAMVEVKANQLNLFKAIQIGVANEVSESIDIKEQTTNGIKVVRTATVYKVTPEIDKLGWVGIKSFATIERTKSHNGEVLSKEIAFFVLTFLALASILPFR